MPSNASAVSSRVVSEHHLFKESRANFEDQGRTLADTNRRGPFELTTFCNAADLGWWAGLELGSPDELALPPVQGTYGGVLGDKQHTGRV